MPHPIDRIPRATSRRLAGVLCLVAASAATRADEPPVPVPFKVPPGWKAERFAAEPQLANPVAFCLDERGRVYVAEEFRFNRGTEENRTRPFLLDDDLQIQTLDDRLAMFRKWADRFEGGMAWFSRHGDQVRRLEDVDGDGKADRSTVFAGGFNGTLDGLAAGVLARDGDVFLTCIPNLWRLRDTNGDGVAEVREVVHTGFGVNAAFLGHDLHGLTWGPDGKLYFSVGDRGFHVQTREGTTLHGPRTGAVFRCDPDGANLEVVARGLRNPQELAFDDYGRLFAVDNNCDKGDHSRLVFVVEGGDSGWNMAYQTIPEPYLTGPWHAEQIWHMPEEARGQPAWIVPPVGKLGAGPSGFVAAPGIGLPERYKDHFFYCNFTSMGGVESFKVEPKGAGFAIVDAHPVVTPVMATDVDFGYDGTMYLSEFGRLAWDGSNSEGRIYTVTVPERAREPVVAEVRALFRDGSHHLPAIDLEALLAHPDRRVRQRAQSTLATRGEVGAGVFERVARTAGATLPRLHAVWGLGQLGRVRPEALRTLPRLLADADPHVRAQVAKVLGARGVRSAGRRLVALLNDVDPHVRLEAALALGKLRHRPAVGPVFAMLAENADRDPFLRHAGVMALVGIGDDPAVLARAADPSPAVRRAVLLVERRRGDARIARFLDDPDPSIATEAARAINDLPIEGATRALADRLPRLSPSSPEPLWRRAIHAAFRLGRPEDVERLVAVAAGPGMPEVVRREVVEALGDWGSPAPRDRVNGFWRPLPNRDLAVVRDRLSASAGRLIATTSGESQARVFAVLSKTGAAIDAPLVLDRLRDIRVATEVRRQALRLLAARKDGALDQAVKLAMADADPSLRAEGRDALAALDPSRAFSSVAALLNEPKVPLIERQRGLETLARLDAPGVDATLAALVDRVGNGSVPTGLALDVIEAARQRGTAAPSAALAKLEASRPKDDPLAGFRACLEGGDAVRGAFLFTNHAQAQCVRCHRVNGQGGTAGPDLAGVATRHDREGLLRSLVEPDAAIASGFATVQLALRDGQIVAGILKGEANGTVTVETPGGSIRTVPLAEVEERTPPRSAMPRMGGLLTPREVRDLVEFLARQNAPAASARP